MTTPDLTGKTALITGASRGIGAAVAKDLAKAGAHVILLARTQGGLEAVDDEIKAAGGQATLIKLDLLKLDHVDQLGPTIAQRFGGLDILIGNAGILGPLSPVGHIDPKEWYKVMSLNFMANVRLVRTLDPLLRKSEAGRVVFTTMVETPTPMAYWGAYSASKAALNSFALTYAAEVKKTNIKVNLVRPGVVQTALLDKAFPGGFPGKVSTPEEVTGPYLELSSPACTRHGAFVDLV